MARGGGTGRGGAMDRTGRGVTELAPAADEAARSGVTVPVPAAPEGAAGGGGGGAPGGGAPRGGGGARRRPAAAPRRGEARSDGRGRCPAAQVDGPGRARAAPPPRRDAQ